MGFLVTFHTHTECILILVACPLSCLSSHALTAPILPIWFLTSRPPTHLSLCVIQLAY